MTIPQSITSEIQKLAPSAVVELFEIDATAIGGDVLRVHAGTNQLRQNVVWQGNTYTAFPMQATGFDFSGNGQLPRPKLVMSNVTGAMTLLVLTYEDLLGAKVTRRRTLAKYLDAVNFTGGVNPSADPTAEFPVDIFYIDRKAGETRDVVEFELASSFDVAGVKLPRRQIIQNVCTWRYRGTECGYTGDSSFSGTYQTLTPVGVLGLFKTATITATSHGIAAGESFYFQPTSGGVTVPGTLIANSVTANTISTRMVGPITSGSCFVTQVFDANDTPVASVGLDKCGKRLSSCKVRFGANNPLPFGSFPAAGLTR